MMKRIGCFCACCTLAGVLKWNEFSLTNLQPSVCFCWLGQEDYQEQSPWLMQEVKCASYLLQMLL